MSSFLCNPRFLTCKRGFPGGSDGKESACNAGDLGSIPGLDRSPEEGNGYPLQYCCLENPTNKGVWRATVHGVAKSRTRLSDQHRLSLFKMFASVQSLSHVWLFATPWTTAHQASLSITSSQTLLKLMSMELVMPSNRLILCHPLLLLSSIFLSIRDFSNESVLCIRWPEYCSFSFSISPSNEYSGLTSFRMEIQDEVFIILAFQSLWELSDLFHLNCPCDRVSIQ